VKLFILSAPDLDSFQIRVLQWLFDDPRIEIVGACIDDHPDEPKLKRAWRDLRKGRGGYVLVKAVNTLLRRTRQPVMSALDYFSARHVPVLETGDLYARETLDYIRRLAPDCLFRSGFGIIREPVLSLAGNGVLSYHHGDLRRYRGTPVAFWELYHGERQLGVTVQMLVPKLDAGRIVREIAVPIEPNDSWRSLQRLAYEASERMLLEACLELDRKDFEPVQLPDEELGQLYTEPNLRQWSMLQMKVAARRLRTLAQVPLRRDGEARPSRPS
jgi:methionyl-tRNA formyltransferase